MKKSRYLIYIRRKNRGGKVWWCEDTETGKQESLGIRDEKEAQRIADLKNNPDKVSGFHLQMAKTHLNMSDPEIAKRTWQSVMDAILKTKTGPTLARWEKAAKSKSFDAIRNVPLVQTKGELFIEVLKNGTVSTNVYLRRLHNFAFQMEWILRYVLPPKLWPKVQYKEKRAISLQEHLDIIAKETNAERKAFYQLCWETGGSQSDVACLCAENIDWQNRSIAFFRKKSKQPSHLAFGDNAAEVLKTLPTKGPLFPYLASVRESDRATEFGQRCEGLGIEGVTLHSYRYAWAERSAAAGYPERFAQRALGQGSKAVHRAYAKNAEVRLPSLEEYEKRMASKIVPLPIAA